MRTTAFSDVFSMCAVMVPVARQPKRDARRSFFTGSHVSWNLYYRSRFI